MSGSFQQLNQKYNTLLALLLQIQSSGTGIIPTLQEVLEKDNVANSVSIELVDLPNENITVLSSQSLTLDNGTQQLQVLPNTLSINGSQGLATQILRKNATNTGIEWANPTVATTPTLADVLDTQNIASQSIDMDNHSVDNISSISISTAPISTPDLTFTRTSIPIVVDGVTYYLGLFTVPP